VTVPEAEPLGHAALIGFVASSDLDRSRAFYEGILGFEVTGQDGFACVLQAGGTTVRLTLVPEVNPAPYTVLGWEVADLEHAVDALAARGVSFLRFEGMDQDTRGIWTAPGGDRVSWFPDPEGHVLSLTQPHR
jgi:catechol 2,3-dioxygenase-like lactoylglutathione lyase family enzyme